MTERSRWIRTASDEALVADREIFRALTQRADVPLGDRRPFITITAMMTRVLRDRGTDPEYDPRDDKKQGPRIRRAALTEYNRVTKLYA